MEANKTTKKVVPTAYTVEFHRNSQKSEFPRREV
jgi:hypothetical protein